uniref:Uncharacterized protein n=1 Tax=Glossina austeni TaxID=7395 RepID=A0A1A9VGH6_GLOAU
MYMRSYEWRMEKFCKDNASQWGETGWLLANQDRRKEGKKKLKMKLLVINFNHSTYWTLEPGPAELTPAPGNGQKPSQTIPYTTEHAYDWSNCRRTSTQIYLLRENCLISKVSHVCRSSIEEQRYLLLMQGANDTRLEANFCYPIFQDNMYKLQTGGAFLSLTCRQILSAKVNGNEAGDVIAVVADGVVGLVDVIIGVVAVDIVNSLAGLRFTIVVLITVVVSGDEGVVG